MRSGEREYGHSAWAYLTWGAMPLTFWPGPVGKIPSSAFSVWEQVVRDARENLT